MLGGTWVGVESLEFGAVCCRSAPALRSYLTGSVSQVVLQKSILSQIRQLILHISDDEGLVDGFEWKLTFAKRLRKNCLRDKSRSWVETMGAR